MMSFSHSRGIDWIRAASIDRIRAAAAVTVCIFVLVAPPGLFAEPQAATASLTVKIATVDLQVCLTLHPAMRNFDHRSGKFVSQVGVPKTPSGIQAWNDALHERSDLEKLRAEIDLQADLVNSALSQTTGRDQEQRKQESEAAYGKLAALNADYQKKLAALAAAILGAFPDSLLGDVPAPELERIFNEIRSAIREEAASAGVSLVLNIARKDSATLPSPAFVAAPPRTDPKELLSRWRITSLTDLEDLIQQASGSSPVAIGRGRPDPRPGQYCGGHFESVTDPELLESLLAEYIQAKNVFSVPFQDLGATALVFSGSAQVESRDLTIRVIERLFSRYKTPALVRDTTRKILLRLGFPDPAPPKGGNR